MVWESESGAEVEDVLHTQERCRTPYGRREGMEDGNVRWGWCLCSLESALPVQTQLLALLRNPVDALLFLLLALHCAARAQAGPWCSW